MQETVCLSLFFIDFFQNISDSDKHFASSGWDAYRKARRLRIKQLLKLSDLNLKLKWLDETK
jgi:hypothetical protein